MAPTFVHGKGAVFQVTDTGGAAVVLSSGLDSLTLDRSVETAEVTAFGDDDKLYLSGLRDATFSASGHHASTYHAKLNGMLGNSTATSFQYSPAGTGTGNALYTGSAHVTSLSVDVPVGDKVSMSIDFQITGPITSTVHT